LPFGARQWSYTVRRLALLLLLLMLKKWRPRASSFSALAMRGVRGPALERRREQAFFLRFRASRGVLCACHMARAEKDEARGARGRHFSRHCLNALKHGASYPRTPYKEFGVWRGSAGGGWVGASPKIVLLYYNPKMLYPPTHAKFRLRNFYKGKNLAGRPYICRGAYGARRGARTFVGAYTGGGQSLFEG